MNNWQKDWWQEIEETTVTLEKFFQDVNQTLESFADELGEALEDFSEKLQDTVITEVDRCVEEVFDFVNETNRELELNLWEDLVNDPDFVEITTERPNDEQYTACIGCRNYHGQAYNGQILVCGIHPYGVEDNCCPDWEGFGD